MARKREERAIRSAQRAQRKARQSSGGQDPNFVSIRHQLATMGLALREIPGDGNCMFRALGDQLDGTPNTHQKHRQDVVTFMRENRSDFEPFVEDDVPFEKHLGNLAELGTYGGNDCIVAFARLHGATVVIHQLNTPLWQIFGVEGKKNVRELHISYHNGDHYNSVRKIGDFTHNPAGIKLAVQDSSNANKPKYKSYSDPSNSESGAEDEDGVEGYDDSDSNSINDLPSPLDFPPSCWSSSWVDHSEPVYEALSSAEQNVMDGTGCHDLQLIRGKLSFFENDVRAAIEAIKYKQFKNDSSQSSTIWEPHGTGTRIFGENAMASCVPTIHPSYQKKLAKTPQEKLQLKLKSPHLSNGKRQQLKKQLRKQQSNDRKSQNQYGANEEESDFDPSDDSEVIIVKDIGCLSI